VVEWIWRYPLKSAQGECVPRVFLGPDGPDGDRLWAAVSADGIVVSAKSPRRWGRMLYVAASVEATAGGGNVVIRVPGGEPLNLPMSACR
jgi:MOSC domain-containing protein